LHEAFKTTATGSCSRERTDWHKISFFLFWKKYVHFYSQAAPGEKNRLFSAIMSTFCVLIYVLCCTAGGRNNRRRTEEWGEAFKCQVRSLIRISENTISECERR